MLLRSPDQYNGADWQAYVLTSISRETGKEWADAMGMAVVTKKLNAHIEKGVDPYTLAVAIDFLCIDWWDYKHLELWKMFEWGWLTNPVREYDAENSPEFWRGV